MGHVQLKQKTEIDPDFGRDIRAFLLPNLSALLGKGPNSVTMGTKVLGITT